MRLYLTMLTLVTAAQIASAEGFVSIGVGSSWHHGARHHHGHGHHGHGRHAYHGYYGSFYGPGYSWWGSGYGYNYGYGPSYSIYYSAPLYRERARAADYQYQPTSPAPEAAPATPAATAPVHSPSRATTSSFYSAIPDAPIVPDAPRVPDAPNSFYGARSSRR